MPVSTLVIPVRAVEAGLHDHRHATRHEGLGDVAVVDPLRGDRGSPAIGLRLRHHPLRPAAARPRTRPRGAARRPTASASPTCCGRGSRSTRSGHDHRLRLCRWRADGVDDGQRGGAPAQASRRSSCPTSSASPSAATGGCASSRPPAGAPGCPHRGGCGAGPSSSGRRRWCGRRCRSRCTPTAESSAPRSAPAGSPATGSTTATNRLSHKSGLTDFKDWYRQSFGRHSPWGDEDSEALVYGGRDRARASLSARVMRAAASHGRAGPGRDRPRSKQGEPGTEVFLVLDGVIRVERDGERLAEYGPGALLGERAHLEGGARTSTHRRGDAVPGGHGRGRPVGALGSRRALGGAPPRRSARETERVRVHFCGTRGSTPAPGPEFVRYGGHTSCVALVARTSDAGPTLLLDAGTGLRRSPRCSATRRSGHHPPDPSALGPRQGLPFFQSGDHPDAQVTLAASRPGRRGGRRERAGPHDVAAALPDPADDLRGDWTFESCPGRRLRGARASRVVARDVPHKGGRTVGYRVTDGRSTIAYIPDHCPTALGPGPGRVGRLPPGRPRTGRDVDVLDPRCPPLPRSSRPRPRSATPRPTTPSGSDDGRAHGGSRSSTTGLTAPTPRSTRSSTGSPTSTVPVIAAAEGSTLEL